LVESLLITGSPASGKSRIALEHFRSEPNSFLVTPTATMAEHIRNELARVLTPVRPSRVITLAQFLNRTGAPTAASKPALHLAIQGALDRIGPGRIQAVAEYRGFRNALASLLEEVEREALPRDPLYGDLARLYDDVERELAVRGSALRNARFLMAAARLTGQSTELPSQVVFDGFFAFSNAELKLIESLAARAKVVVTLPAGDWTGAAIARSRLLRAGFAETTCTQALRTRDVQAFCAPTLEQETEEIARRILDEAARGRPFREMGIVLRSRDPYAPALETTLARFGIPARFYFADVLTAHPAVDFLSGVVRAILGGWDHAELLRLVRMPVSGVGATPAGDGFDFELRKRLPGRGLPLAGEAWRDAPEFPPAVKSLLDSFAAMDAWTRARLTPADWAARLRTLRTLIPPPAIGESVSSKQLNGRISTARALDAFDAALDETAALLGTAGAGGNAARIALNQLWPHVEAVLELKELRLPDRRRDVVHVFDVFEARQWELPMVFVCGMNERHFPQYHREDPLLGDGARRRAGLETSADLQREERSLFQLATTRATVLTVLSYARFDERGEATLPSLFLDGFLHGVFTGAPGDGNIASCDVRVRPRPSRDVPGLIGTPDSAPITDPELLESLATAHRVLSPSSIESFLQCPFQFFGRKTLRMGLRPPHPRDRLNMLVQGSIIHAAIAGLEEMPLLGAAIFDDVFAEEISRLRIPGGYRTEAVRLEMLRNFSAFLAEGGASPRLDRPGSVTRGWSARVEEQFRIALTPALSVRGRIDRLEVGPNREALVIDYKYSPANKIRERKRDQDSGDVVQAGLYLLAAVREFGLKPAGMLYCGLKKEVEWAGWHVPLPGLEAIGELCTPDRLEELTQAAETKAVGVFESIIGGDIGVRPADEKKCAWCDYRDVCRVDTR